MNLNDQLDLNQLQSIKLGIGAFIGDSSDTQRMVQQEPFNYNNTLIMKSRIHRLADSEIFLH